MPRALETSSSLRFERPHVCENVFSLTREVEDDELVVRGMRERLRESVDARTELGTRLYLETASGSRCDAAGRDELEEYLLVALGGAMLADDPEELAGYAAGLRGAVLVDEPEELEEYPAGLEEAVLVVDLDNVLVRELWPLLAAFSIAH